MFGEELAWCLACGKDVSVAHAVAEFPCPSCGGKDYFVAAGSVEKDMLLSLAERMQRVGRWEIAERAFLRCAELRLISAADRNLSLCNLRWRMECAASALSILRSASEPVTVDALRSALVADYDEFVVTWLLRDFAGLRLVPAGKTYTVEEADTDNAT